MKDLRKGRQGTPVPAVTVRATTLGTTRNRRGGNHNAIDGKGTTLLRAEFAVSVRHTFHETQPADSFAPGWHFEVIAPKLAAVRAGYIRRLIINMPPRHLKSHLASVAFPAWCLGHEPGPQLLCVSRSGATR